MSEFGEYDVVRFKCQTLPGTGGSSFRDYAHAGECGVIVDVIRTPFVAYTVEIMEPNGRTIALVTAQPSQIELVEKHRPSGSQTGE